MAELESPGAGDHALERDDGYIRCDPGRLYFTQPAEWFPGEREALAHSIVDIGPGAGGHSVELQRRGHRVVALDLSPGAAEACRRRGVSDVFTGTVDQLASRGERFDTLVLLGHNLGFSRARHGFLRS